MPRLRLILLLGLPDPDRLSTTLLWSVLGHTGLLIGVLIYQILPSSAPPRGDSFFVRLAAPAAGGGAAEAPSNPPPDAPSKPIEKHAPPSHERVVTTPVPSRTLPDAREVKPRPPRTAPHSATPPHEPATGSESEGTTTPAGTDPEAIRRGGQGAGLEAGVGAASFGEGDFSYGWYQTAIESKLQSQWRRPIASSIEIQTAKVSFTILRDGSVQDVKVAESSSNSALDLSALRAVYDANPLPKLPRAWSGESVHVSMEFRLTPGAP